MHVCDCVIPFPCRTRLTVFGNSTNLRRFQDSLHRGVVAEYVSQAWKNCGIGGWERRFGKGYYCYTGRRNLSLCRVSDCSSLEQCLVVCFVCFGDLWFV